MKAGRQKKKLVADTRKTIRTKEKPRTVFFVETFEPVEQQFECGVANGLILYGERADAEVDAAEYNLAFEDEDGEPAYVAEVEVRQRVQPQKEKAHKLTGKRGNRHQER